MRIAFLATGDPGDRSIWSGMLHATRSALGECVQVIDLRVDVSEHSQVDRGIARALGAMGHTYVSGHAAASALRWGRATTRAMQAVEVDAVVALAASSLTAFATFGVPLISVSDSTFTLVSQTYPVYRGLPSWAVRQAQWVERRSWQRSDVCVVTSQWALDSLTDDYQVPLAKCRVIPFGPGITPPAGFRREFSGDPLRMLLVAGDWQRKRGDRVLAMLPLLENMGIKAHLTVVGAPESVVQEGRRVTWLPRISQEHMAELYARSDILLDLAEGNCASVTLIDAAAWGLQAVATDVGAAREIIKEGITGVVVPNGDTTPVWAARAVAKIARQRKAAVQSHTGQAPVNARFDWNVWSSAIVDAVTEVVGFA